MPMKLVSMSPTTLLKTIEIRGLEPTSCHGSQGALENCCFAESDKSLRHRSRRNTRRGCTWHRKIPRELLKQMLEASVLQMTWLFIVFEIVPSDVGVFCFDCMRFKKKKETYHGCFFTVVKYVEWLLMFFCCLCAFCETTA